MNTTHKRTPQGKQLTAERKAARTVKYGKAGAR